MENNPNLEPLPALSIVYRDDNLVAVCKPAGLLVHRSEIDRRETHFLVQTLRDQLQQRVYTVHRLDKPTSGLMLFALDEASARSLSQDFMERRVTKQYQAIVRGHISQQGQINYNYVQRFDQRDAATHDREKTVTATTDFECREVFELAQAVGRYATARYSRVRLSPRTGARHQLRRHMKHVYHPIIGDTTYGDSRHNKFFRESLHSQRLLLCATGLIFDHPVTGEKITLHEAPDKSFQQVVDKLSQENLYTSAKESLVPQELQSAYIATHYRYSEQPGNSETTFQQTGETVTLTINKRCEQIRLNASQADEVKDGPTNKNTVSAFITAHNPYSESCSAPRNASAHQQLCADLSARQLHWYPAIAESFCQDWPAEAGVYVQDIRESELREIGGKYGQNAVVVVRSDRIPRLLLLR